MLVVSGPVGVQQHDPGNLTVGLAARPAAVGPHDRRGRLGPVAPAVEDALE
jgi:hypothetical protein